MRGIGRRFVPVLGRILGGLLVAQLVAVYLNRPGPEMIEVQAKFDRAGLNVRAGDEVRVRGFPVGAIRAIDIDRSDFSARYTLAIDRATPVAADTTAAVVPKTLYGDKYVELQQAEAGQERLADGAVIPLERTRSATELSEVLDRLIPAMGAADPAALGGMVAALATGLGDGTDVGRTLDGFEAMLDEFERRRTDLALLLEHAPGAAGAFAASAGDLAATARNFGTLAQSLADSEPDLGRFLAENADLMGRAAELLTSEHERLSRLVPSGLTLLDLTAQHPGALGEFLAGAPAYIHGLPAATFNNTLHSSIANLGVVFPRLDSPGELCDCEGGPGFGPDITTNTPPPPSVNLSTGPAGEGLAGLLGGLLGGGPPA